MRTVLKRWDTSTVTRPSSAPPGAAAVGAPVPAHYGAVTPPSPPAADARGSAQSTRGTSPQSRSSS